MLNTEYTACRLAEDAPSCVFCQEKMQISTRRVDLPR